jgi:hypothetical protein
MAVRRPGWPDPGGHGAHGRDRMVIPRPKPPGGRLRHRAGTAGPPLYKEDHGHGK